MKKVILAFILGLSLSTISAVALSLCNAKDIVFNADDTTWDVDTVSDALNDLYKSKGSNTNDSCNDVAKPKLGTNGKLIPITLSDDGKATVVSETDSNWYNYCEKRWANAVILNDEIEKEYNPGDTIPESEIESMFVWIPKYKYKLWNVNLNSEGSLAKVHTIDIIFDTNDTIEEEGVSCVTPMIGGSLGKCSNGEYMTHPAFISFDVDGFWVGKFETGYKTASNTAQAQVNSNNPDFVVVKPNSYTWRYISVRNMFEVAYNYDNSENRDLDSHMMKNVEWGAVAYLSHSKYGINDEININNNSSYKTGHSAIPELYQGTYPGIFGDGSKYNTEWNTENGFLASTTGNITGVYDMSGGAWEYMAAYRSGSYGSNSGFSKTTLEDKYAAKYYEAYNANSVANSYQYMILGDAIGELGPFQSFIDGDNSLRWHSSWYNDYAHFIDNNGSWLFRGGYYLCGALAGQFAFGRHQGAPSNDYSFRLVLSPAN